MHLGHDVVPSTTITVPRGARSAVCSTARSSVMLMCSPANIASRGSTPAARPRDETGEHRVVDAVLGVVDAQVADLDDVALGAAGVGGEQLAEVGGTGQLGQRRARSAVSIAGGVHRGRT